MHTSRTRNAALCVACMGLVLAAAGCGEDGLEAARAEVERIEREVERARAKVERRDAEASEAEEALARARDRLEEAEQRLADARRRVETETDEAQLFRAVQRRLLDEEDLEDVAITAHVERRTVTLEGSVPEEATKQRAEQIAAGVEGVETVVNRITVDVAAPSQ